MPKNEQGRTVVHRLVDAHDIKGLQQLLRSEKDPMSAVNAPDHYKDTPLHLAVRATEAEGFPPGYFDIIRLLCKAGANIEARNDHLETPLIIAAGMYEAGEVVKLLFELGANP